MTVFHAKGKFLKKKDERLIKMKRIFFWVSSHVRIRIDFNWVQSQTLLLFNDDFVKVIKAFVHIWESVFLLFSRFKLDRWLYCSLICHDKANNLGFITYLIIFVQKQRRYRGRSMNHLKKFSLMERSSKNTKINLRTLKKLPTRCGLT